MKQFFFNFLIVILINFSYAQTYISWETTYGGTASHTLNDVIQTIDGGYILTGNNGSSDGDATEHFGGYGDLWVVKIDPIGNIEWQRSYGGTEYDPGREIIQISDGGYIVLARTSSSDGDVIGYQIGYQGNAITTDTWVIKLSSLGEIEWQKCLGGSLNDYPVDIIQTNDGGYAFISHTNSDDGDVSNSIDNYHFWLVKLNAEGTIMWDQSYGTNYTNPINGVNGQSYPASLLQTIDGGFIISGETQSNYVELIGWNTDALIIKTDSSGNVEWRNSYGGSSIDRATDIIQATDGGYIFIGDTRSTDGSFTDNNGGSDIWVVKLDSLGEIEWMELYGSEGYNDESQNIIETSTGYIFAASVSEPGGDVIGFNGGDGDAWIVEINNSGEIQSQNCIGSSEKERVLSKLSRTLDGGYIFGGVKSLDITTPRNWWVVKLSSALAVEDITIQKNINIYPNPTVDKIFIVSNSPQKSTLFNLAGQKILESNALELEITDLPSGIYLLNSQSTQNQISTFKIIKK